MQIQEIKDFLITARRIDAKCKLIKTLTLIILEADNGRYTSVQCAYI